jgi:hypothetical protein
MSLSQLTTYSYKTGSNLKKGEVETSGIVQHNDMNV